LENPICYGKEVERKTRMERLATMFQKNRVDMTFMDLMNTATTVAHAILIALGLTFLVMWGVALSVKRTFKVDAKNDRFKYWTMRCDICKLELYGSSQVSLNKTFNWHAINKHPDAQ
jgi:hypothetical protein